VIICLFVEIIDASDSINSIPVAAVLKAENETFVLTFEKEDDELFRQKPSFPFLTFVTG
jgi:hypothetical protein